MIRGGRLSVLALAVLFVACGGSSVQVDQKKDAQNGGSTEAISPPANSGAAQPSPAAGGGPAASRPASGGTAQAGTATSSGEAAAAPAPPGTYRFDTKGHTTLSGGVPRPLPPVTTLEGKTAEGVRQRFFRDLRDQEGYGTLTESILLFQADGVRMEYLKVVSTFPGGLTDTREFKLNPPELLASTGVKPGERRQFTMNGSGTTAQVTIEALRTERIAIGGTKVDTVVARIQVDFSGAITGRQTNTSWFWPKHLLAVKEQVTTDITNGPIQAHTEYEATVQRLGPS